MRASQNDLKPVWTLHYKRSLFRLWVEEGTNWQIMTGIIRDGQDEVEIQRMVLPDNWGLTRIMQFIDKLLSEYKHGETN